jgi:hypothetical protein
VARLYIRVISSVLLVIVAMLVLQNGLNQLKFRSLVADATASRLQVVAGTINGAIARAEGAGLAISEMTGLADLLAREKSRNKNITGIAVVSPTGRVLVTTDGDTLPAVDRAPVLRRVLGSGERRTSIDRGERLYVGRVLRDSASAVMGAVVISTPTEPLVANTRSTTSRLNVFYIGIFAVVTLVLVPFVLILFAPVRHLYAVLRPEVVEFETVKAPSSNAAEYAAMITAGNSALAEAEAELDELAKPSDEGRP